MKKILFKTILFLISFVFVVVIVLLALEIGFRKQNKYYIAGIEYDKTKLWHWRKNLNTTGWNLDDKDVGEFKIHTDKYGYRNYNKNFEKKDNSLRILVIGDSYTAGLTHPDDKIYTTLLEEKLQSLKLTDKKVEVFNMACPCWGTEQEYLCLTNEGLSIKPDYVLLMVCPNDIRETYCKKFARLENGEVKFGTNPFSTADVIRWKLSNYSYFYQYLQKEKFLTDYGTFEFLMSRFTFNFASEGSRAWDNPMFLKKTFPEFDEALQLHFKLISMMKQRCNENKIQFAVTNVPYRDEFDGTIARDTLQQPGLENERLKNFCAAEKIPFVNMNARFGAEQNPVSCFRPSDAHYSTYGHQVVADELTKYYSAMPKN